MLFKPIIGSIMVSVSGYTKTSSITNELKNIFGDSILSIEDTKKYSEQLGQNLSFEFGIKSENVIILLSEDWELAIIGSDKSKILIEGVLCIKKIDTIYPLSIIKIEIEELEKRSTLNEPIFGVFLAFASSVVSSMSYLIFGSQSIEDPLTKNVLGPVIAGSVIFGVFAVWTWLFRK